MNIMQVTMQRLLFFKNNIIGDHRYKCPHANKGGMSWNDFKEQEKTRKDNARGYRNKVRLLEIEPFRLNLQPACSRQTRRYNLRHGYVV